MRFLLFIFITILFDTVSGQASDIFELKQGTVTFTSDAPLELINAKSTHVNGLLDAGNRTFAFSIPVNSFRGFNNPLQYDHFNENYLESRKYSQASFLGKIIESVDLFVDGDYTVRAKGKLNIHGVERERIIKCFIKVNDGHLIIRSTFMVPLSEHDIEIPRIVFQKIAEEIAVEITGQMEIKDL